MAEQSDPPADTAAAPERWYLWMAPMLADGFLREFVGWQAELAMWACVLGAVLLWALKRDKFTGRGEMVVTVAGSAVFLAAVWLRGSGAIGYAGFLLAGVAIVAGVALWARCKKHRVR